MSIFEHTYVQLPHAWTSRAHVHRRGRRIHAMHSTTQNLFWLFSTLVAIFVILSLVATAFTLLMFSVNLLLGLAHFVLTVIPAVLILRLLKLVMRAAPPSVCCMRRQQLPHICQPRTACSKVFKTRTVKENNGSDVHTMTTTSDAYHLTLNVAGLKLEDLTVQADGGYLLKVQGETHVCESLYAINRLFAFPPDAIIDEANAVHENAMLNFTVPRRVAATDLQAAATSTIPLPATAPMPSMVQAVASAPTSERVATAGPSPVGRPHRSLGAVAEAGHSFVLAECEAHASNVQVPPETTEELLVDTPTANLQPTLVDGDERDEQESVSYIAGYQRALEDVMKIEPEAGTDEAELTDASVDDDVADAATESREVAPLKSEQSESEWMDEWDTLLDDLEEMGFADRTSNRSALSNHGGQMKPAVRHLVSAQLAPRNRS